MVNELNQFFVVNEWKGFNRFQGINEGCLFLLSPLSFTNINVWLWLFQGISAHSEELLKHLNYIGDAQTKGLVVFSWGDDNNDHETRRKLREQGIDGLIYDR